MKPGTREVATLLTCLLAGAMAGCAHPASKDSNSKISNPKVSNTWNPKTAAAYLDYREAWWNGWTGSARDHGTFCVSCHTALPYALSRPTLRDTLAERGPTDDERRLIENVTKRVRLWKEIGPYYGDQGYDHKTAESRGTESVLNALILASHDAPSGELSADTRAAFDNMWALQQTTGGGDRGSWPWLQFDQEPWEARDSVYYGAALAAIAAGTAPGNYASATEIQPNLASLREYLNRESAAQSTINHVFLLWASTKLPGLLATQQQKDIIAEIMSKQQRDGGWRLASISWKWNGWTIKSLANMWLREDGTPIDGKSDGVATSLITLVLQEAGVSRDNPHLQHGLTWLMSNQDAEGFWPASSVNKRRHISSDTGRFMSDAATAFAVLSLTESQRKTSSIASATHHQ
jgi:squalene-hopene/tetraprenyl-beta-curcumene cyclase